MHAEFELQIATELEQLEFANKKGISIHFCRVLHNLKLNRRYRHQFRAVGHHYCPNRVCKAFLAILPPHLQKSTVSTAHTLCTSFLRNLHCRLDMEAICFFNPLLSYEVIPLQGPE